MRPLDDMTIWSQDTVDAHEACFQLNVGGNNNQQRVVILLSKDYYYLYALESNHAFCV